MLVEGEGEVTRVQGEHVLAWNLESLPDSKTRRLVLLFNQPQKDQFCDPDSITDGVGSISTVE